MARNILDGREYAIKMINFPGMHSRRFVRILREVKSLAALDHTNIVRYHSAWIEEYHPRSPPVNPMNLTNNNNNYNTSNNHHLQSTTITGTLDYLEKSLNEHISSFPEDRILTMYIQMELCQYTLADWIAYRNRLLFEGEANARKELMAQPDVFKATALGMVHTSRFFVLGKDSKRALNMYEIKRLFKNIVRGLAHIHFHGLIHRDLKPQNIFLHGDEQTPKIGDFGLVSDPAVTFYDDDDDQLDFIYDDYNVDGEGGQFNIEYFDEQSIDNDPYAFRFPKSNGSAPMTSGLGTTTYAAPEQLTGGEYNEKSDIFSLGLLYFELIYPFATHMERVTVLKDLKDKQKFPPRFVRKFPKEAAFIWSCLAKDPNMRPSAWEILESELLDHDVDDLISKLAYENDTLRQMLILQENEAHQLQELNDIQMDEIEALRRRLSELDPLYRG